MPFVKINLAQNLADNAKKAISLAVHESLMEHFNIPEDDYFQVIHEIRPADLLFPQSYMNIPHTGNMLYIEITASHGRTVEMKKALYRSVAQKIAARTSVSENDVFIVLTEVALENWSFGQGLAQMVK
jgi:phenylpyruvate tautomerase PptA (4-oxalocrotonate tautomerase family)